jgi:hypothetical protein
MRLTGSVPGTAADTARALDVVRRLRSAIAPYQTLQAAAAAGYHARRDSTAVRTGRLLHAGRRRRAAEPDGGLSVDPPQSLLYRRVPDGSMRLAGAMLVAPPDATAEDLDAMIPLSVARWHRHVNVCAVREGRERRVLRRVSSAEECTAAGGRFRAKSRYMIHVMTDAGDDLAQAFPQGRDG